MTFVHASAAEWTADHSASAPIRLGMLEIRAFQHHPDIYADFGIDGAAMAARNTRRPRSGVRRFGSAVLVVLAVIGVAAPIGAIAALGGDRFEFWRMDAEESVPLAGVLFIITALTQLGILVGWLRSRRFFDPGLVGIVVVSLIFSCFGLAAMPNIAARDDYATWEPWYPTVIASVVLSGISAILMFMRFRTRAPEITAQLRVAASSAVAISNIRTRVAALPADERAAILTDRNAALDILRSRGLIADATHDDAVLRDLGTLFALDRDLRPHDAQTE